MVFTNNYSARLFTIRKGAADPLLVIAKGRNRWALEALIATGFKGCPPIDNPTPHWSAYVHKLRKAGVGIEAIAEKNSDPFTGHHARYVLTCNVTAGCEGGAA